MWRTRWGLCLDFSIRDLPMWPKLDSNAWNTYGEVHPRSFTTRGGGSIDILEVMVDASLGPPHEGYRSVQGIMMTHCGNPIMWGLHGNTATLHHPKHSRGRALGVQRGVPVRRIDRSSFGSPWVWGSAKTHARR